MPTTTHVTTQAKSSAVPTPIAWASAFLKGIGAPVTANNIASIIAWGIAESGKPVAGHPGSPAAQAHGGWNNFNPLNVVVQSNDHHSGQGGTQGDIADFATLQDGVNASVRLFLHNGNAKPIIATLKADSPITVVNSAVNQFYGSWGGSISFSSFRPGDIADIGKTTISSPGSQGGGGGIVGGIANGVDGIVSAIPIIGGVLSAPLKAADALLTIDRTILGVFTNWRYVVEVFAGLMLVGVGILILLIDTGAAKKGAQLAGPAVIAAAA